ncbi:N-6 DNA methylase [Lacticaseibacillus suilingensis]|uniref:site-specific DNA-methyltransferase (adenine-specific) n=1 Tax=Lacticaseibacillus suilingensis TaxID=2799577 RepID=A0ABW4BFQ6_9LACO|nr:N-6 DNA methylase [Lacticaseibacillus suilingensis]
MSYDAVISNPPYSLDWSMDKSLTIDGYPLAPKSKADWQFVLEGIDQLNDNGTAVYVLPHGVLFRGASEGKIRQRVIEEGHLDAVIGLPDKLFDVTGIPVCLLVLKKHRTDTDTLFIDASNEFEKGKNKNVLKPEHVRRVVEAYHARKEIDKYAHVATLDEMRENDFNLNITRYVDTFEPEPVPSLTEIMNNMTEIDAQITHNEQDLADQFAQLVASTPEAQAELDRFVQFFGKRAKQHREEQLTLL